MKFSGLVKTSLIDYPDLISAVIFTQGCNYSCGFCHNPDLVPVEKRGEISEEEIFSFLNKRVGQIQGIVVTGGEPTIQPGLTEFLKGVKKIGYLCKLDTNGSNPLVLAEIIKKKLVDYIAMDIKGPLDRYKEISGFSSTEFIQESIRLIMSSDVDYEFRTTFVPRYHRYTDIRKIGVLVKGARRFTIQNFRPGITLDNSFSKEKSFTRSELEEIKRIIEPFAIKEVRINSNI